MDGRARQAEAAWQRVESEKAQIEAERIQQEAQQAHGEAEDIRGHAGEDIQRVDEVNPDVEPAGQRRDADVDPAETPRDDIR